MREKESKWVGERERKEKERKKREEKREVNPFPTVFVGTCISWFPDREYRYRADFILRAVLVDDLMSKARYEEGEQKGEQRFFQDERVRPVKWRE